MPSSCVIEVGRDFVLRLPIGSRHDDEDDDVGDIDSAIACMSLATMVSLAVFAVSVICCVGVRVDVKARMRSA